MEVVNSFQNLVLPDFGKEWVGLVGTKETPPPREQVQHLIDSKGNLVVCGHESFADYMSTEVSEGYHEMCFLYPVSQCLLKRTSVQLSPRCY